jgi:hypothetical protein
MDGKQRGQLEQLKGFIPHGKKRTGPQLGTKNLGKVKSWINEMWNKAGKNIDDFDHEVTTDFINHALKQHGNPIGERNRGNVHVTKEDFEKIPDIIESPDLSAVGIKRKGLDNIAYAKHIGEGSTVYHESLLPKKKVLQSHTMYKKALPLTKETFFNILKSNKKNDISKAVLIDKEEIKKARTNSTGGNPDNIPTPKIGGSSQPRHPVRPASDPNIPQSTQKIKEGNDV